MFAVCSYSVAIMMDTEGSEVHLHELQQPHKAEVTSAVVLSTNWQQTHMLPVLHSSQALLHFLAAAVASVYKTCLNLKKDLLFCPLIAVICRSEKSSF